MSHSPKPAAVRLQAAIDASGLSVRALALRMAERELAGASKEELEDGRERHRRNLNRWLSGKHSPDPASAAELAAILGGDADDYRDTPAQRQEGVTERLDRIEAMLVVDAAARSEVGAQALRSLAEVSEQLAKQTLLLDTMLSVSEDMRAMADQLQAVAEGLRQAVPASQRPA